MSIQLSADTTAYKSLERSHEERFKNILYRSLAVLLSGLCMIEMNLSSSETAPESTWWRYISDSDGQPYWHIVHSINCLESHQFSWWCLLSLENQDLCLETIVYTVHNIYVLCSEVSMVSNRELVHGNEVTEMLCTWRGCCNFNVSLAALSTDLLRRFDHL